MPTKIDFLGTISASENVNQTLGKKKPRQTSFKYSVKTGFYILDIFFVSRREGLNFLSFKRHIQGHFMSSFENLFSPHFCSGMLTRMEPHSLRLCFD